jgi:hypothetical protein
MSVVIQPEENNFYLQGSKVILLCVVVVSLIGKFLDSLDGSVKLWDLRGADVAAKTWDLHPNGLSAFDVHSQTNVFAG